MSAHEIFMKDKGEAKVWKTVTDKKGGGKKVGNTQLGQQMLLTESLELTEKMRDWIETKSSKLNRKEYVEYFIDDDFLLKKIMDTLLLLSYSTYAYYRKELNETKARHKYINLIKKKIFNELDFDLVWRFVEVLIDYSTMFEQVKETTMRNDKMHSTIVYQCTLPEKLYKKLVQDSSKAFFPEPITMPPQDWRPNDDGTVQGGYHTYQYEMVRLRTGRVNYLDYSQQIYDTINYIQAVAWKVSPLIVRAVERDLKIPLKEDYVKSIYPDAELSQWHIDIKAEGLPKSIVERLTEERNLYSKSVELYNAECQDFESAVGKYRATKLAVDIAKRYIGEERIYFPHSFDSRGRIYPIPVGLSPQGSDAVKAMIEYTDGEVLNEDGKNWAWAYLASLWGDDKITFYERVERGKELIDANYLEADEPYQFLAHQLEIKEFIKNPDHIFRGRVHLDACNSGSQFTSIITGDRAGCEATNVIPTFDKDGKQLRQDAYLLVADKSKELTKIKIETNTEPEKDAPLQLLKTLLEEKGRKMCKTPVMVSNYGGTAGGRSEIIWHMLREFNVDREFITKKNASMFSSVIGDSITGVLNGGKAFETYIHKMNNVISKKGNPVRWTTSDGFKVTHVKQKELKPKQVSCMLPNSRRETVIHKKAFSDEINPVKMKSAISPNYIHSLDAELLRRVALGMKEYGLIETDWIHDSFGCHPNHVTKLLDVTKLTFKTMMKAKPLAVLDAELRSQADDSKATIKLLEGIKMPQLGGINDDTDFDLVFQSEWFFS